MSAPVEPKSNPWVLPALIVWALAPAILIAISVFAGWNGELGTIPGPPGEWIWAAGILGMPFVLYGWSITLLLRHDKKRLTAGLLGIPLTFVMCLVNLTLGIGGCSLLSTVVPREGIF